MGCVFSKSHLLLHVFLNFESSESDFVKPKYFKTFKFYFLQNQHNRKKTRILVFLCMLHTIVHQAFPFLVACSSRQVLLVQNNSVPLLTRGFLFVSQVRTHRCLSMVRCHLALQANFLLLRLFKWLGFFFVLFWFWGSNFWPCCPAITASLNEIANLFKQRVIQCYLVYASNLSTHGTDHSCQDCMRWINLQPIMIFDIKSLGCVGSWVDSDHWARDKQVIEPQQFVTFKKSMNNSLCNWQGNWV